MNVRKLPGFYSLITGVPRDLDVLQSSLDTWSVQYDPGGTGCRVWQRTTPVNLRVLTGAYIDMMGLPKLRPRANLDVSPLREAGLRDYQGEVVDAAIRAEHGMGIITAPGGSGKTHMAAGIIAAGAATGVGEWLYLVQNKELAAQTQRTFDEAVPRYLDALGGGDVSVQCSSYGTVDKEWVQAATGLIVDEVHGVAAPTRAAVVLKAQRLRLRFGMSATPLQRQDPKNALVVGLLGPVIYEVSPERLIQAGFLARGRFHVVCL